MPGAGDAVFGSGDYLASQRAESRQHEAAAHRGGYRDALGRGTRIDDRLDDRRSA